jgi:hypothetical protein
MTSYQELQGFAKTNIKAAHIQSDAKHWTLRLNSVNSLNKLRLNAMPIETCRLLKSKL